MSEPGSPLGWAAPASARAGEAIACAAAAAAVGGERLASAVADVLESLTAELVPGLLAEEQVLFPLLEERPSCRASLDALRCQHRQIRALTETLSATTWRLREASGRGGGAGAVGRLLGRLGTLIDEHRRLEDEMVAEALAGTDEAGRRRLAGALAGAERRARSEMLFVAGPRYAPTEAWVMRGKARPARVLRGPSNA